MERLTKKQSRIRDFIRSRIRQGLPPTCQEIADEFRIKPPTAWTHLRALKRRGVIRLLAGRARGIELAAEVEHFQGRVIPVLGRVAAGGPFPAEENQEGTVWIDEENDHGGNLFALQVYGDSMIGAGILDGDLVIAEAGAVVKHGDIVVARIAQEATVKRLWCREKRWYLRPENRRYRSIELKDSEIEIQGKVLSLRRLRV